MLEDAKKRGLSAPKDRPAHQAFRDQTTRDRGSFVKNLKNDKKALAGTRVNYYNKVVAKSSSIGGFTMKKFWNVLGQVLGFLTIILYAFLYTDAQFHFGLPANIMGYLVLARQ
ncbi:MAG: hypothetical protein Q8N15_03065, partial [Bacillota bacterium]|nr:hypothetical protein [Bacillota bacterium]